MDIFRTLGSGSLSVTAMLDFLGKTIFLIHGLGEDDTATPKRQKPVLLTTLMGAYCAFVFHGNILYPLTQPYMSKAWDGTLAIASEKVI